MGLLTVKYSESIDVKKCSYDMIIKSIKNHGIGVNLYLSKNYGTFILCQSKIFDLEFGIEVGKICYYLINVKTKDLMDKADDVSGDLGTLVNGMLKRSGKLPAALCDKVPKGYKDLACLIDYLYIEPEFRNLGIGTSVIKSLDGVFKTLLIEESNETAKSLNRIVGYYLIAKPQDVRENEMEECKIKLMKFYEANGFKRISDENDCNMIYELWANTNK